MCEIKMKNHLLKLREKNLAISNAESQLSHNYNLRENQN